MRHAPLALLLVLAGCDLGPTFTRPEIDLAYRANTATAAAAWPAADWWRGFGSAELDALIARAREHNQDIIAAMARVRQADAQVRIAGAALLPQLNASGSGNWRRSNVNAAGQQITRESRQYGIGLDIGYEIDFWGKNRAARDAAEAEALASRFDQQTVALTITAAVAETWFSALALHDRLQIAQRNLADAEQTLRVIRGRLEAGTANALDLARQEAQVAAQRAQIPALRNQMEQLLIALGILTGQPPAGIDAQPGSLTRLRQPEVAPGLPAELLARRPDVAAVEAQLRAANADIRAARAAFLPSIRLTGSGGLQSAALSTMFGPGGFIANLAAGITQPIFDGGTLRGRRELSEARQEELVALYRKAVLQALTDVDAALTAHRLATEQEALQRQSVARAQRAAAIARAQLEAGTVDLLAVLQAQTALYAAQDSLAQARQARFLALVDLFKALGGGWNVADLTEASVVPPVQ